RSTGRGRSMLIQRRASCSTTSTAGVSGSGVATTSPRVRAERPKRGLGKLGTGTEGVVGRHRCSARKQVYLRLVYTRPRIQRGGGTGPVKPRQPSPASAGGTVPIPDRLHDQAWEMWSAGASGTSAHSRRRFFHGHRCAPL